MYKPLDVDCEGGIMFGRLSSLPVRSILSSPTSLKHVESKFPGTETPSHVTGQNFRGQPFKLKKKEPGET